MLKVFTNHPCTPPNMLLGIEEVEYTTRKMFRKQVKTYLKHNYSSATAFWRCPVCDSEWVYSNRPNFRNSRSLQEKGDADYGWSCNKRVKMIHEIDETIEEISGLGS